MKIDHLVLATHNKGKAEEISELLAPHIKNFSNASDFDLPEPEETGSTFEENASLKAVAAAKATGIPALADDSGLCVEALGGAPGIYSARWAGPDKNFNLAMEKINDLVKEFENRKAAFVCVLALAQPDGSVHTFEGRIEGNLCWPPRGDKGFGYDPVFVPLGETDTFAEMDPDKKNAMSHRARAFSRFVDEYLN